MMDTRIPIVMVTGFLGSGKTTFINNLLAKQENKKIAIIENEFAELGIDSTLINKKTGSDIFELNNGCICCTMNGELEGVFGDIVKNKEKWDYVLLETTGVADPSPIVNTFMSNPLVNENFRLDCIYTIVDSKNFPKQINREFETKKQIAFANKIVLNKIDLITRKELGEVNTEIKKINPEAQIVETTYSGIDLKEIFNENSFEIGKIENITKSFQFFSFEAPNNSPMTKTSSHTEGIESFGISFKEKISISKFDFFIRGLIKLKGENLYRLKGIVNIEGSGQPIIFQGVHDAIDWFPGPPWKNEKERESKMVFIGKGLNREEIDRAIKKLIAIKE